MTFIRGSDSEQKIKHVHYKTARLQFNKDVGLNSKRTRKRKIYNELFRKVCFIYFTKDHKKEKIFTKENLKLVELNKVPYHTLYPDSEKRFAH